MLSTKYILSTSKRLSILSSQLRNYSQEVGPSSTSTPVSSTPPIPSTPGLSEVCIETPKGPVGPGVDPNKSGPYKVPEYFCYNNISYFEAEIEMAKYRLPQPNADKK